MSALNRAYEREISAHLALKAEGNVSQAWHRLERAHILSQQRLPLHLRCHLTMLGFALDQDEWSEMVGQLWRLALAPIGSIFKRIPWGNTGRANVSAFQQMEIPDDLRQILHREGFLP